MKEFLMIFRSEKMDHSAMPAEQSQAIMKQWQDWIGAIAAKGKFSGTNRLMAEGKTIRSNKVISDGPYMEGKELIGGYMIVKAGSLDEATEMAKACPILQAGGNVEVRTVLPMEADVKSGDFLNEKATA
jgi:hypothetical protein